MLDRNGKTRKAEASMKRKPMPDKVSLSRIYHFEGLSCTNTGKHFKVSHATIWRWLHKLGIPRRKPGHRPPEHCIEPECKRALCRRKDWRKGKVVWSICKRCAQHQHLYHRNRQKNKSKGLYRWRPEALPNHWHRMRPGTSTMIAPEDRIR